MCSEEYWPSLLAVVGVVDLLGIATATPEHGA